jgi:hypothetical protein
MIPGNGPGPTFIRQIIYYFYYHVSLLAVPAFIVSSLYLFMEKASLTEGYWKKRLLRLANIFLFWVGVQFCLYLLLGGKLPLSLNSIPDGGPALPTGGASIFYFLVVLIKCTILSCLFLKLPETIKWVLSVVVLCLTCLHFGLSPLYEISIGTTSMDNYYVYIPMAYYLAKYRAKFPRYRLIFFTLFVGSIFIEEFMIGHFTSAYGRLSILFGVLFSVSLLSYPQKPGRYRVVSLLSRYSLGIFALHLYWISVGDAFLRAIKSIGLITSMPMVMEKLLLLALVVALTGSSIYLLSRTRLRRYVS